jgi:hypothetical protein
MVETSQAKEVVYAGAMVASLTSGVLAGEQRDLEDIAPPSLLVA